MTSRRALLTGLVSLIAAPALVRCTSLMQVRGIVMPPSEFTVDMLKETIRLTQEDVYWMGASGFYVSTNGGPMVQLPFVPEWEVGDVIVGSVLPEGWSSAGALHPIGGESRRR